MAESTNQDNKIDAEELLEVINTPPEEAEHPTGMEMHEWVFTNDKQNPLIRHLYHMIYRATFANKIGLMHAKNKVTGEIETLLVGVDLVGDGQIATWPLAKVLSESEQDNYAAPRGDGTYVEQLDS